MVAFNKKPSLDLATTMEQQLCNQLLPTWVEFYAIFHLPTPAKFAPDLADLDTLDADDEQQLIDELMGRSYIEAERRVAHIAARLRRRKN